MKLAVLTFVLLIQISWIKCDDKALECIPQVARVLGVTFCNLFHQSSSKHDTSQIKVVPTMFHGQYIDSSRITAISISGCDLDSIPSAIYKSFGPIKWLMISNGKLGNIKYDDFKLAVNLKKIEITGTNIDSISSKAFSSAKNLEELTINDCDIGNFSEDAFDGLENLKTVNLKGNRFNQGTPNFINAEISVIFS